jgi:hypothetical protein
MSAFCAPFVTFVVGLLGTNYWSGASLNQVFLYFFPNHKSSQSQQKEGSQLKEAVN